MMWARIRSETLLVLNRQEVVSVDGHDLTCPRSAQDLSCSCPIVCAVGQSIARQIT